MDKLKTHQSTIADHYTNLAKQILNFLNRKYSSMTIDSLNFNVNEILLILRKNSSLCKSKDGLNKIINAIELVIKNKIHGPNTKLNDINLEPYTNDNNTTISYDNYTNNNPQNLIDKASHINEDDNITLTNSSYEGGVLSSTQENVTNGEINIVDIEDIKSNNIEIYLYIDSKDRDRETYKFSNDYKIDLSKKGLLKVKKIELIDAILIDSSNDEMSSDNMTKYPYLCLELSGLPNRKINPNCGSNENLEKTMALLTNPEKYEKYNYYKNINMGISYNEYFELHELGIKVLLPNGELFNFGNSNNDSIYTVNMFKFKLTLCQ